MSSTSRAWIVVASVGVVEALKDQSFSRWNYAIRSIHQHAKNRGGRGSFTQAKKLSSSSSAMASSLVREEKIEQTEESMRKVIYLNSWGP